MRAAHFRPQSTQMVQPLAATARTSSPRPSRSPSARPTAAKSDATGKQPTTPFRDVFVPHSIHSREGRLSTLLRDYTDKTLAPSLKRVEVIAANARRSCFLPDHDRDDLIRIADRHQRFMANSEAVLQAAVDANAAMDRCVVERCHERWHEAHSAVVVIEGIITKYSTRPTGRGVSAARRGPPLPRTLNEVVGLTRRPASRSPCRAAAPVRATSPVTSGLVHPQLAALAAKRFISAEEARDAQALFVVAYGAGEGKRQFLAWLSQLPTEALRALQQQLPHSKTNRT
jgi:hypothetical protein